MSGPLEQFQIKTIIPIAVGGIDISFTNSSLALMITVGLIISFFTILLRTTKIVPTRSQAAAEQLYNIVTNTISDAIGDKGKNFRPLILSMFTLVLMANLLGMIPIFFTATSHIAVTFTLAIIIFLLVVVLGFYNHGVKFLKLFLPNGTPLWLAPLMIVIELFSFLSRPITLSMRLAANMIAGHVLLKVMAGFVLALGAFGLLPLPIVVIMNAFELFVAILQAYIFTILACVYLNDAINMH